MSSKTRAQSGNHKKTRISLPQLLVCVLLSAYLLLALMSICDQRIIFGFCSTVNECVTFYSIRFAFLVLSIIFGFIKNQKDFYVPLLKEMPNEIYWGGVLLIILMMQPLIPYKSSSLTRYPDLVRDIKGFNFMLITYFSLRLLIDFQQKVWADHLEMLRTKRIQKLMQKAKLTEIERLYILNFRSKVLDELAINFSKSPRIWKVTLFVFSIILGATLSYYAKNFVDFLGNYIDFKNLIPPF